MKKMIKRGLVALALVASMTTVALSTSTSVSAETISPNCVVRPHSTLTRTSDNRVQVKIYIEPGCPSQQVSLMVYKMHGGQAALSTQKLFSYISTYYPAGEHTISTNLPDDCFFQADLFKGGPILELTDGGDYSMGLGYLLGGSKDCLAVTPTPTPTPATTPVTPVVTAAATTPAVPVEEAKATSSLTDTGPGSIVAGAIGVAMASGLGYNLLARRRSSL